MNEYKEENINKLQLSLCLLPIVGFIPALWHFFLTNPGTQQKKISRLSITLILGWFLTYICLWLGTSISSELFSIRLLYLNGILTTTYFLTCIFLMIRIWQRKSN